MGLFFYLRVLRTSAAQLKIHSRLFTYVGAHRCVRPTNGSPANSSASRISSYVGAHRRVRPTNALCFHQGRHIGLPLHCGCYLYSLRNLRINFSYQRDSFLFLSFKFSLFFNKEGVLVGGVTKQRSVCPHLFANEPLYAGKIFLYAQ